MLKKINSFLNLKYTPFVLSLCLIFAILIGCNLTSDLDELCFNSISSFAIIILELIAFFYLLKLSDKEKFFSNEDYSKKYSDLKYFTILLSVLLVINSFLTFYQYGIGYPRIALIIRAAITFLTDATIYEIVFRGIFFTTLMQGKKMQYRIVNKIALISSICFGIFSILNRDILNDLKDNTFLIASLLQITKNSIFGYFLFSQMLKTSSFIYSAILSSLFRFALYIPNFFQKNYNYKTRYISDISKLSDDTTLILTYLSVVLLMLPLFFAARKIIRRCTDSKDVQQPEIQDKNNE